MKKGFQISAIVFAIILSLSIIGVTVAEIAGGDFCLQIIILKKKLS